MFKRILCAIDFSKPSAAALRSSGGLAKAFGAELVVLHAQRLEAPEYFTVAQIKNLNAQLRRSLRAARQYTERFVAKHLPGGVAHTTLVLEADPVDAILRALKSTRANLVALGTHGRTGLARLRLGSVSESVLRQATRPVLTVGPGVRPSASLGKFRRILCPVNYSDVARRGLEYAVALAERTGAELTVAHVLEEKAQTSAAARQELCDWITPRVRERCAVQEVVRSGNPAEQILAEIAQSRADLLVMGAQHRDVLGALLFGSTTERVLRSAPCPVFSAVVPTA